MSAPETCSRCHQLCRVASFPRRVQPNYPALARDEDGRAVCDRCVGRETLARLFDNQPATVYLVPRDGVIWLTTWDGFTLGRVSHQARGQAAWSGYTFPDAIRVYGRQGDAQVSTARAYKNQARAC